MGKRKNMDQQIGEAFDNLTPEQVRTLIQIADPLTPEEQAKFDAMTDDELLAELTE